MQALTPLRLRPMVQRICCLNEAHRSSRATASLINQSLMSVTIPDKPKRPGNPFLQFIKDVESKIYADKPDATRQEIMRTASSMWREADDSIKTRYNDIFKEKNKEYVEQLEVFHKNLTTEQKAAIAELDERMTEKKKSNKFRKVLKELGKPLRPPSGYGLFLMDHPEKKRLENETNEMRLARMTNDWRGLSESEKTKYMEKARELLNNYVQDLREWERNILKKLDMSEEDINALAENNEGKPNAKKLSNQIITLLKKKEK